MSGEIQLRIKLAVRNPTDGTGYQYSYDKQQQITQAAPGGGNPGTVTFTDAESDVSFAGLSTPRIVIIENLDDTLTLIVGPKSSGSMVEMLRIPPGEAYVMRLGNGVTLRGKASAAGSLQAYIASQEG